MIQRVDSGSCTHARPTYVSEIMYDQQNVYSNVGDSVVAMGRIAWTDAWARKAIGDHKTYETKIGEGLLRLLL